ncbi:MAG: putative DNA binding domain-containing protein [Planctomycetaceae bacterium]|nr:putative DNA binding domain-containing protein [Planctomycetaceae bacterium]
MPSFQELFERLQAASEILPIEAKTGSEIGRSILQTVCAYANEPGLGGGYLLLGVAEEDNPLGQGYRVVGVDNPDKLQNDLVTQCGSQKFNVSIRPEIMVEAFGDKRVVVVFIPESPSADKPVYIKDLGIPRGAFRRVGASDVHCTDADIEIFYQNRSGKPYEDTVMETVNFSTDISEDALESYRRRRASVNPHATELTWSNIELLQSLRAVIPSGKNRLTTVCGLLSFGKDTALRREMPMARVDYIRINGRRWVPTSEVRFQTVEMRGPLLMLIPRVISTVMADIPVSAVFEPDAIYRKDVPLIPEQVIREAIVNALMHRNYRTRQPIQIIRYTNRIEVRNPGCSLKPDAELGTSGSVNRNEKIAAILHECNLAETKGAGIRIMREQMANANLTTPLFESDRYKDSFAVTLFTHHFMGEEDIKWLANFKDCDLSEDDARTLVLLKELGQIDNEAYRLTHQLDTLAASTHLRKLRDFGLLEQQGRGNKTYYIPGKRFLDSLPQNDDKISANTQAVHGNEPTADSLMPMPTQKGDHARNLLKNKKKELKTQAKTPRGKGALIPKADPLIPKLESLIPKLETLPQDLADRITQLGQRASPTEMDALIEDLCRWQPLNREQLGHLLGRGADNIRNCIRRMLNAGRLVMHNPDKPTHPDQKYSVPNHST